MYEKDNQQDRQQRQHQIMIIDEGQDIKISCDTNSLATGASLTGTTDINIDCVMICTHTNNKEVSQEDIYTKPTS